MPRNEDPETGDIALPDPTYSMQASINGAFDAALTKWAQAAKNYEQLEWGSTEQPKVGAKAQWIRAAWKIVETNGPYNGKISALSDWHENFDETRLRIDSSQEALEAYREGVARGGVRVPQMWLTLHLEKNRPKY